MALEPRIRVSAILTWHERLLLCRHEKPGKEYWLLPGGGVNSGESLVDALHRELEEEVGMKAASMTKIAEFYNSPGFCDEHSHLFLATGLTPCATSFQGHEEQHMTIERVALDAVPELIASGELVDAKSIVGLLVARERLRG